MKHTVKRGVFGANMGAIFGSALGTLLTGVTLALPGVNIAVASFAAAAAVTTVSISGSALGTVVGGTAGMISGAIKDHKEKETKK